MAWKTWSAGAVTIMVAWASVGAQIVAFGDPSEWMTQRDTRIVAKVQLDTAQIPKKKIRMGLYEVVGGKKRSLGPAKEFAVKDYSGEFPLGTVSRTVLGGLDYLGIEWSLPGSKEAKDKGVCEPFGLVVMGKWPGPDLVTVRRVQDNAEGVAVAKALDAKDIRKVGAMEFALAWNSRALWAACRKGKATGVLELVVDGKNGKNAFLSYPDRVIHLAPARDSAHAFHYKRSLKDGKIEYREETWHHEMTTASDDAWLVVGLPWHDLGVIPGCDTSVVRTVGLGVFALDAAGQKTIAALPAKSVRNIPGTWGDAKLACE